VYHSVVFYSRVEYCHLVTPSTFNYARDTAMLLFQPILSILIILPVIFLIIVIVGIIRRCNLGCLDYFISPILIKEFKAACSYALKSVTTTAFHI
jgi:hypothetical protein